MNNKYGKSSDKIKFERKNNKNGKPNPKYVDLLDVDKSIAGQNFGCFSFITPEKILKKREMFFFEEFLKKWEFTKSMEKFTQFLNFIAFKYKVSFDDVIKDFEEFVKEEKASIVSSSIEDDYKTFIDNHEDELEKRFNIENDFQTSVRGFKSRGNFPTQEEAELRAKLLRENDPNFDIFVGPVGQWLCWDPEAYKTGKTEYMEEELNQLMHEKVKNEAFAKNTFEQRIKDTKKKAIEENMKNAEKSGNVLTQTIDDEGNLIGIQNTQESKLLEQDSISVSDIRSELFEGENIVVGKTDYGRSELISGPFALKSENNN
jgi:hypothetical protein